MIRPKTIWNSDPKNTPLAELPVDPKFRAKTRIRAKWAKWSEKGPNFGILARFLKNGDIFFFNNNKAIAKITLKII